MVGRLVEEEDVRRPEEEFGELDAHSPSSGELACGAVEVGALEAESEERLLDVLVEVGGVDGVEPLGEGGQLLDEQHVVGALVVGAGSELVVDAVDLRLDFMEMGERLARFVEHGALVFGKEVLGEVGHDAVFGRRNGAACGCADAGQDLEQRALAGSVLAHESYAVLGVYLEGDVFKKGGAAELDG